MNCTGQDPLKSVYAAQIADLAGAPCYPLDDPAALEEAKTRITASTPFLELAADRLAFRRFGRELGLCTHDFWPAETFDQLSAGVLRRERFPLALKSRRNLSGSAGTYRLEGFRDLTRFWERLQKVAPGPALVEDWVNAQVILELTLVPDGLTMAVQVGLEQSLVCRTAWRMFPVVLPERWKPGVTRVIDAVRERLATLNQPVRLHLALVAGGGVVPLSLNLALNRLEYLPRWSGGAWEGRSLATRLFGAPAETPLAKGHVVRLQMLRRPTRLGTFPESLPAAVTSNGSLRDYAASGRHAAVMMSGSDPKKLAADARTVATLLAAQEDGD